MDEVKIKSQIAGRRVVGTRKLATLAMLAAVAYAVMVVGRIPMVSFLKYDPKDVIIAISGFMFGPLAVAAVSVVVSLLEMVTVSDTGFIGLIMNVLSTCAFVCTASFIYKKRRSMSGAVIGLVVGALFMTAVMILWNYLVTPIYMRGADQTVAEMRQIVVGMLVPVFLPFNLLKSSINAALTLLLYKPVVASLRMAKLLPATETSKGATKWGVMLCSAAVLATCVLLVLVMRGII